MPAHETGLDLVYVNDRDAWTNATFAYPSATEVLTLPGVRASALQSARNTALSIDAKARFDGLYGADWNGDSPERGAVTSVRSFVRLPRDAVSSRASNVRRPR